MKRKFIAGLLSAAAALSGLTAPVSAYEFPNAFWAMNDGYQAAMSDGDNNGIINFGTQSIQLMETQPLNDSTIGVLSSRSYEVANAYERLGEYEKAAEYFEKYVPYGEQLGEEDGVKIALAKADAFVSTIDLYTLTDEPLAYHWAKLEPKTGVYFGQVSEETEPRDSMTLIYQEYGEANTLAWLDKTLSDAEAAGQRAELALNFPKEGNQLGEIINDTSFISEFCAVLAKHQSLPIYLRIGAEMNVWTAKADAGQYIEAFRKVANAARAESQNIATVWSVSHTSPVDVNMDDYYPGDEYVDWVGISCYAVKYFQGRELTQMESHNEIYFKAGDGADPCRLVKEVVEKYGDKKPIMLAESGSARYTTTLAKDSSEWAELNMLRMYSTVMMRYPQVKLAAYFNKERSDEAQYFNFADTSMKQAFDSITSMPWFIQNGEDSAMTFKQADGTLYAEGNSLELYALPYVFKDQQPRVDYFIDGVWTGAAVYLPYGTTLDLSGVSDGSHTLEAVVTSDGAEKARKQYTLVKSGAAAVSSDGFTDTAALSDTQHEIVKAVSQRGIITGDTGGTFRPNDKITRAEFAVMVCRAFGYEASGSAGFTDTAGHWGEPYINACVKAGAIGGYGDGNFGPDDSVTAEQAAKIITVCAGLTDGKGVSYPDGFVSVAEKAGLFKNVTEQNHAAECTRIDAAAMFYNIG